MRPVHLRLSPTHDVLVTESVVESDLMSDNDVSEKKLPGKSIQIVLFVVFAVIAAALVFIVKPFGSVNIEPTSTSAPAPGAAPTGPSGAPPAK